MAEHQARLSADPARLHDEAAALSLIGGRRLIRVREAGDAVGALFERFLRAPPAGDSLIVVEAGDLGARSALRLVFEAAEAGAALPCYTDDEGALARVVAEIAAGHGIQLDGDAQAYLAANLVGDRQLARREVEKQVQLSNEIINKVSALILVANNTGGIVYASPSFEGVLGFKPEELQDDGWWRLSRTSVEERIR